MAPSLFSTVLSWALKLSIIALIARYFSRPRKLRSAGETVSIRIVVLGDIGRSPRMQYHAISFANAGFNVYLVGYTASRLHSDILTQGKIKVVPLRPFPLFMTTGNRSLFLLLAPLKVLFQLWSIWEALYLKAASADWMIVQNPPAIPTLAISVLLSRLQQTRLVIDWHNLGFSILSLKLGPNHFLVRISEFYENSLGRFAHAHICVTHAMAQHVRKQTESDRVFVLCDRPASIFQPLTHNERNNFLDALASSITGIELSSPQAKLDSPQIPMTARFLGQPRLPQDSIRAVRIGSRKLLVSPTSWTPDEDFGLLLESLVGYSKACKTEGGDALPELLVVITGKGPDQARFEMKAQRLADGGQLLKIDIMTAFFDDVADYAKLLGSADVGISLHTSSSGIDLPMKVLDMFGAALPVAGWSAYKAWAELVYEGSNGLGFDSAAALQKIMEKVFVKDSEILKRLQKGAAEEGRVRWEDEWTPVCKKLFDF